METHMPLLKQYGADFQQHFAESLAAAFRELLSNKHLYQSVHVDDAFIAGVAQAKVNRVRQMATSGGTILTPKHYEVEGRQLLAKPWVTRNSEEEVHAPSRIRDSEKIELALPTINTVCARCGRQPCNPKG